MTNTQPMTDEQIAEKMVEKHLQIYNEFAHDDIDDMLRSAILEALSLRDREEPVVNNIEIFPEIEYVTPGAACRECGGTCGVHLVTCSKFRRCSKCSSPMSEDARGNICRCCSLGPLPVGEVRDGK